MVQELGASPKKLAEREAVELMELVASGIEMVKDHFVMNIRNQHQGSITQEMHHWSKRFW
jgi:hypothetical protein